MTSHLPRPSRPPRRPLHGVLLLDKPLGLSSQQALYKVKSLLRAEKAGHTGTLDPMATGVLPLCFGAATKFSQTHLDARKTYQATVSLGVATATGDQEGEVVEQLAVPHITSEKLAKVQHQFTGNLQQLPPMYSALKKDGKPLYAYARQGQVVEREERNITIFDLQLTLINPSTLSLWVTCSKGTYIRTLGEDIAKALDTVGHLTSLRRLASGDFSVQQCVTWSALEGMQESERLEQLRPVASLVENTPEVTLTNEEAGRFLTGLRRRGFQKDLPCVRVYGQIPHVFLGMGHITAGELIPDRLLSPQEIKETLESNL